MKRETNNVLDSRLRAAFSVASSVPWQSVVPTHTVADGRILRELEGVLNSSEMGGECKQSAEDDVPDGKCSCATHAANCRHKP